VTERKNENNPDGSVIERAVDIGGFSKAELLQKLREKHILLNAYAEALFADERFTTSDVRCTVVIVELSVGDLGFPEGATLLQVFEKAAQLNWTLCPLELAPHLRIQYTEQIDSSSASMPSQNKAPEGSITIASKPLTDNHEFPKGFYLRSIEGKLWLRGYRCDFEHVWQAKDRFVFVKNKGRSRSVGEASA